MMDKEMVPNGGRRVMGPSGAWSPLSTLHQEMDRLLEDVGRGWFFTPFRFTEPKRLAEIAPRVDIAETEKEIKVTAELPGMDEKDIDVSLEGDLLTLKGEKKAEAEEKGKNYHRVERTYGSFERVFQLPVEVDPTKVAAAFKKGVLTVTLTKSPEAQVKSRKIEVKAE